MKEEKDDVITAFIAATISSRRHFIKQFTFAGLGLAFAPLSQSGIIPETVRTATISPVLISISFIINGQRLSLAIDPRTSLLDALREQLHLTGTKKGCDRGQCGACTVLVNGRRVNSCLTLAAACQQARVTTVEGLAVGDRLHPVQAAFIKHDAFQCGYCTPGQICSAVGLLSEGKALTDAAIREQMSGNICRCGAYKNILDAIKEARAYMGNVQHLNY
ncbi:MAG TPA: 2Fe-2S iron-sulfur cluster-binding protein [Chitinophagaceae bacterium]